MIAETQVLNNRSNIAFWPREVVKKVPLLAFALLLQVSTLHSYAQISVTTQYNEHPHGSKSSQHHQSHLPGKFVIEGHVVDSSVALEGFTEKLYWGGTKNGHWTWKLLNIKYHNKAYNFELKKDELTKSGLDVNDHSALLCIEVTGPTQKTSGMFCQENPLAKNAFYMRKDINFDALKPKFGPHTAPVFAPNKNETLSIKGHILPDDETYDVWVGFDQNDPEDYLYRFITTHSQKTKQKAAFSIILHPQMVNAVTANIANPKICIWIKKKGSTDKPCLYLLRDNLFRQRPLSLYFIIDLREQCPWLYQPPPPVESEKPAELAPVAPHFRGTYLIKGSIMPPDDYIVLLSFDPNDPNNFVQEQRLRKIPVEQHTSHSTAFQAESRTPFSFTVDARHITEAMEGVASPKLCVVVRKKGVDEMCPYCVDPIFDGHKKVLGEIHLDKIGCERMLPAKLPPHSPPTTIATELTTAAEQPTVAAESSTALVNNEVREVKESAPIADEVPEPSPAVLVEPPAAVAPAAPEQQQQLVTVDEQPWASPGIAQKVEHSVSTVEA